ncbi:YeeE/YedE family protein [[Mannheimia] succiniciproducens]|uniref:Uncharacterized protein n=1 Tax=Mannheimia succiniciproducens (strain KCTC 0769BP / MBEL55E) TaxID=221988 RepID=Q65TG1_MANSM|nr:YeeE/YedE family protein [[Mannheimia] succiniciproducens]AAU37749.1 unknown [[Mannheimia] succiniciproducens MBEL55E]
MLIGLFIGLLFGFFLQRGQFCFVSGFRIIYTQRNFRFLTALLIAVSIQSIGFFSLSGLDLITIPNTPMPLLATLIGGLLFGIGMVLANCCASGGWFRTREGAVGSWIALICFALTMAATQTGALKQWINPLLLETTTLDNIYNTFNLSPWILVTVLVLITVVMIVYHIKHPRYQFPQEPTTALIPHRIFTKHWHPFTAAVWIGLLGVLAWLVSEQYGRSYGYGVAVPTANVVQYIVIGQQRYLNWGSYFVLGILLGSFIAAKLSGEFEIRLPEPKAILQRMLGGVIMGIGASLAGGCTITNALVSTAYFSWQGWLATLMIMIGCWLTSVLVKPTQCRI